MAKQLKSGSESSIRSAAMWDWKMMGIMEVPDVLEHVTRASAEAVGHLNVAARKLAVARQRPWLILHLGHDAAGHATGPPGESLAFLQEALRSMARIGAAHDAAGIVFALSLRAHYGVGVDGGHPPYLSAWRTHRLAAFRRIALARERLRCAAACNRAITLASGFHRRGAPVWVLAFERLAGHAVAEANQAAVQLTQLRRNIQKERNIAMAVLFNHAYLEHRVDNEQEDAPGNEQEVVPSNEQEDVLGNEQES